MANSRSRREATSSADLPPKAKINKTTLRESLLIFSYVKPYRWQFAAGLLFIGLSSLSTMAFPYLLKLLIDSAGQRAGIAGNGGIPGIHGIPGIPGTSGNAGSLTGHYTPGLLALAMVGVLSIQMVFSYLRVYLFTSVGEHALSDMRPDLHLRMIRMPMHFVQH